MSFVYILHFQGALAQRVCSHIFLIKLYSVYRHFCIRSIHKIGVTGGEPANRLSGAGDAPTILFAKANLVATFELFNINRSKLETLLHRIFSSARIEIELIDRFSKPYRPKEWFLVPLETIQDAVEKIKDGTIVGYQFNTESGLMEER